jgi:hypothetical protein
MTGIFLHDWEGGDTAGVLGSFNVDPSAPEVAGIEVLLADYTYEDYSGSAWVVFKKDGKLFEVNGGHCSCYGLEGQWEPEETTAEAIKHRAEEGRLAHGREEALRELLAAIS